MTPHEALTALERRMHLLNQVIQEALLEVGYKREEEKKEEDAPIISSNHRS